MRKYKVVALGKGVTEVEAESPSEAIEIVELPEGWKIEERGEVIVAFPPIRAAE